MHLFLLRNDDPGGLFFTGCCHLIFWSPAAAAKGQLDVHGDSSILNWYRAYLSVSLVALFDTQFSFAPLEGISTSSNGPMAHLVVHNAEAMHRPSCKCRPAKRRKACRARGEAQPLEFELLAAVLRKDVEFRFPQVGLRG